MTVVLLINPALNDHVPAAYKALTQFKIMIKYFSLYYDIKDNI